MLTSEGRGNPNLDKYEGKEVNTMNDTTGLDTAVEPVSNEPDTGADVQQDDPDPVGRPSQAACRAGGRHTRTTIGHTGTDDETLGVSTSGVPGVFAIV